MRREWGGLTPPGAIAAKGAFVASLRMKQDRLLEARAPRERCECRLERSCETKQVRQARIPLAPLDPGHVGAVEAGGVCELLLG